MDDVDFAIVKEVMQAPLQGSARIARTLGFSPQTVRNRLRSIERQTGGFHALPSAAVLGQSGYGVLVEGASMADVASHPDAYWVTSYDDGVVGALLYSHTPPKEGIVVKQRMSPRPPVKRVITRTEWVLMPHLVDAPLQTVRDLAAKTGFAAKTVRKYRQRLFDDGRLNVVLSIDEGAMAGGLWHHVFVLGETPRRLHGIPLAWTDPPGALMVLHADSPKHRVEQTRAISQENPHAEVSSKIAMAHVFQRERVLNWLKSARRDADAGRHANPVRSE